MTTPLRCLIIEGSEDDEQLLLRELRTGGFDVTSERVDTPDATCAALARAPWDIVLSDFRMPQFTGLDALALVRASNPDLPFIFVSGTMGEEAAVALMKAGAQDYLMKDNMARLVPAVHRELRDAAERCARRVDEAALAELHWLQGETERIGKVGGWEFDIETQRQTWTDEVYRIHEVERTLQSTVAAGIDFYTPESRPVMAEAVQQAITQGEPFDLELEITTARGNRKAVNAIGRVDLARRKVYGFIQDITERKRSEVALRANEEQLRSYLDNAGDAIYIVKAATARFLHCNARACHDLGYSRDELLTLTVPVIQRGLTRGALTALLADVKRGEVRTVTGEHRRKDGSAFPVELRITSLAPAQPGFLLAMARDITERSQAQSALRESESRFRILSENALTGVYIVKGGVLSYVNAALAAIFGYAREELIGADPLTVIHPDDRALVSNNMRRRLEGDGKILDYEFKGLCKNGDVRPIEVLGVGIVLDDQPALIGNILDITERKRAEAERARLRDELTQSQKLESIGLLAGGVAHDFNNMLAAILGYAELTMQKLGPSHEVYPYADAIRTAAQRSADLTGHLLAFARKQPIAPATLSLNDTVSSILKMLDRLLGERVRVVWLPGAALWHIEADATYIDQVLTNLAVNARDAMAGVDGRLEIATSNVVVDAAFAAVHAAAHTGEYAELRVSDNGSGMSNETLAHLFEPFYTTKEMGAGTGLGLATVFGIMAQHGGFVDVETAPGVGTTFRCYFPRTEKQAVDESRIEHAPLRGIETILLVEDEASVRVSTAEMLQSLGYTVLTAPGGAEAMAIAAGQAAPIQLLLSDVIMPGMNGAQVRDALLARHADLRVMFMSGYTGDVIISEGVLAPSVHFIQKPFTMHALAEAVRHALDGRPPTSADNNGD